MELFSISSIILNKYERIICKSIEHIYYTSVSFINLFQLPQNYMLSSYKSLRIYSHV